MPIFTCHVKSSSNRVTAGIMWRHAPRVHTPAPSLPGPGMTSHPVTQQRALTSFNPSFPRTSKLTDLNLMVIGSPAQGSSPVSHPTATYRVAPPTKGQQHPLQPRDIAICFWKQYPKHAMPAASSRAYTPHSCPQGSTRPAVSQCCLHCQTSRRPQPLKVPMATPPSQGLLSQGLCRLAQLRQTRQGKARAQLSVR